MVKTNIVEENKKNILSITNFTNKFEDNDSSSESTFIDTENVDVDQDVIVQDKIEISDNQIDTETENNTETETENNTDKEISTEKDTEVIDDIDTIREKEDDLLQGGTVYDIDFLLEDDAKLVNIDKIFKQVDIYINNYNSIALQNYKKKIKQLYQKYSNNNYVIENFNKIIVKKTDKTNKRVLEINKPKYYYYDEDNNLLKLKRQISNSRADLLYKYEKLIAKLNITPEEKKTFEKERTKFIEDLETYYIYTFYHKKINKINKLNKSNLILQKDISIYKENNEYESKILNGNIYSIDNSFIDTMNKYNSSSLIEFNNIIQTLTSKKYDEIIKDKNIKESIKTYIKNKNEIYEFTQSLLKTADEQDNYINYIVLELP